MQTQSISPSDQPSSKRRFRAVNYVALADVREQSRERQQPRPKSLSVSRCAICPKKGYGEQKPEIVVHNNYPKT